MKKLIIGTAIVAALGAVSTSANAALASDALLNFGAGVAGGYHRAIVSGSYFAMDSNGSGTFSNAERVGISQNNGLL